MTVFEKIEAQQKGKEGTPAWMVGEQLKEICAADPGCAELVAQDLDGKEMSLDKAAAKIKAYADKQPRKGNCVCVPPNVAEGIIREFYGLPGIGAAPAPALKLIPKEEEQAPDILDLSEFF